MKNPMRHAFKTTSTVPHVVEEFLTMKVQDSYRNQTFYPATESELLQLEGLGIPLLDRLLLEFRSMRENQILAAKEVTEALSEAGLHVEEEGCEVNRLENELDAEQKRVKELLGLVAKSKLPYWAKPKQRAQAAARALCARPV